MRKQKNFGESKTSQQFKHRSDVRNIIDRAKGIRRKKPKKFILKRDYIGDFADPDDFHKVQNKVFHAKIQFDLLPGDLKRALDQDPGNLIALQTKIAEGDQDAIDFAVDHNILEDKYHSENIEKKKRSEEKKESMRNEVRDYVMSKLKIVDDNSEQ